MRYYKAFQNDYFIPDESEDRFLKLRNKIQKLGEDPEFIEAYRGYKIVFLDEFNKYNVVFKKGNIHQKQTEEWMANSPRGTKVKIVKVFDSFIRYRELNKWFGYTTLNKWSFLRIYGAKYANGKTNVDVE